MNLWFRMLLYLLRLRQRPRTGPLETTSLEFRVYPNDLDTNLHMNNGRYLTLMDLGRLDLVFCCGLGKAMLTRGWRPVLGGSFITYRRELNPFQKFRLETRLLGWDGPWFYIGQQFYRGEQLAAEAVVKALFLDKNGKLDSAQVMQQIGYSEPSPELDPKTVARFAR
jgi:acyl-CoA thioesterase FadM